MSAQRTRVPSTVAAYLAVVAVILIIALVEEGADDRLLRGGLVLVLASLGLYRGFWLAWLFLAVVAVGDVLLIIQGWPSWWMVGVSVNAAMFALLLSRPTRAHARRGRPRFIR